MPEERLIRLQQRCVFTKAIGPYLGVFLNWKEVDPATVYALDEAAGWIDFLIPKGLPDAKGRQRWEIRIDPQTEEITPVLNRVTGHVRIKLKRSAPEDVRRIYADLKYGDLAMKLDILRGAMRKP